MADHAAIVVRNWFCERLSAGPIARDTPAYNQLIEALPDLVKRLGAVGVVEALPEIVGAAVGAAQPAADEAVSAAADEPAAEPEPEPAPEPESEAPATAEAAPEVAEESAQQEPAALGEPAER